MSLSLFRKTTEYKCSKCSISSWNDRKIILEIDHIDGNNQNNDLINLRYLCPNCHSQTSTWRGRNKNTSVVKVSDEELFEAFSETNNIRQALIKVGLAPKGGNYNRVSKLLKNKHYNFKNGTIWINNGSVNKKIKKIEVEEYISLGYKTGRLYNNPPSIKGKVWITNGIINKMCYPEDNIPQGFFRGKVQKNKT